MRPTAPWTWFDDTRAVARPDWPAPTARHLRGEVPAVHRGRHWVLWSDGAVTSTVGVTPERSPATGELRPDAVDLVDAVWHSGGHRGFDGWARLARVERVVERETLGVRWPRPWEERLERLVVESVDGSRCALFLHAVLPEERPSAATVTVGTVLPESVAGALDRPEPLVLYDLETPLHGAPKVPASAPRYILVRPDALCATAFHRRTARGGEPRGYLRRDHASLRAAMTAHRLHPNQVRPVWAALHAVALVTVAGIEAMRWAVKATPEETPGGLMLRIDGEVYGPCGNPWDIASILAARSTTRRKAPVRSRVTGAGTGTVSRGRVSARR